MLGDEGKREIYDRFGVEGLKHPHLRNGHGGTGGGGGLQDQILRSFFGSASPFSSSFSHDNYHRHRRRPPSHPRNEDVHFTLHLTLEDLYSGTTRSLLLSSSHPDKPKKATVQIPRGSVSGQTFVLSGEIDSVSDATPGDLIVTVRQKPHGVFTRRGHDLAREVSVSWKESLCGFGEKRVECLGGRAVTARSPEVEGVPPGVRTGDVHVLKGEGMPRRRSGSDGGAEDDGYDGEAEEEGAYTAWRCRRYGDLYLRYRVEPPPYASASVLSADERRRLGVLLDKLEGTVAPPPSGTGTRNVRSLSAASPSDFGRASGSVDVDDGVDVGEEHLHRGRRRDVRRGTEGQSRVFGSVGAGMGMGMGMGSSFFGSGGSGFGGVGGEEDDGEVQCQQM